MQITIVHNEQLLQKAITFNTNGIVMQQNGYSYLKIDDDYIHELYTLLKTPFILAKPDYFSPSKSAGAHITIIYNDENIILAPEDLGKTHTFMVKNLCSVVLNNKEYFVLLVSADSLTQLRIKYGLPEKPYYKGNEIEFHITIAHVRVVDSKYKK